MKHADLGEWDRTRYILGVWGPAIGYATGQYGYRLGSDAVDQIVLDELMATADRFPEWCDETGTTPSGALFWSFVTRAIDQRAWKELRKVGRETSLDEMTTGEDGSEMYWARVLIAAGELAKLRQPSIVHQRIADRIALFPTRWKLLLALRFHREMPVREVAEIVSATPAATTALLKVICDRVMEIAKDEILDDPEPHPTPRTNPWEVPFTAHRWVWMNTPYPDVSTMLGLAQRDYALDVGYIVDMLWTARGVAILHGARGIERPEKHAPCGTESAYQRHKKHGDVIDEECTAAHLEYNVHRRAERAAIEGARARGEVVPDRRRRPAAA